MSRISQAEGKESLQNVAKCTGQTANMFCGQMIVAYNAIAQCGKNTGKNEFDEMRKSCEEANSEKTHSKHPPDVGWTLGEECGGAPCATPLTDCNDPNGAGC